MARPRSGAAPPRTASSSSMRWAGRRGSGRLPSISMAARRAVRSRQRALDRSALGGARQRHRSGAVRRGERPRGRVRRRRLGSAAVRHRRADEPRPLAPAPPAARATRHRGRDRQPGPGRRAGGDARRGRDGALDLRRRHRPALELADRAGARRRRRSDQPRDRVHAGRARAAALQPGASSRHAAARRRDPAVVDTPHPRRPPATAGFWPRRRSARSARNTSSKSSTARTWCAAWRRCLPRASPTPPR